MALLKLNRRILDHFGLNCIERIGNGAYGDVFLCRDRQSHKFYALKLVQSFVNDDDGIISIAKEARIIAQLHHENIVRFYASEMRETEQQKSLFIKMEYCEGGTLYDMINSEYFQSCSYRLWYTFYGIANGLNEIHRQSIIHRDLKPENILMTIDMVPKVADFGVSTKMSATNLTSGHGTYPYIAPEAHGHSYSLKADIYSLGVIGFEMVLATGNSDLKRRNELVKNLTTINSRSLQRLRVRRKSFRSHFNVFETRYEKKIAKKAIGRMISFKPENRPTSKQILEGEFIGDVYMRIGFRDLLRNSTVLVEAERRLKATSQPEFILRLKLWKALLIRHSLLTPFEIKRAIDALRPVDNWPFSDPTEDTADDVECAHVALSLLAEQDAFENLDQESSLELLDILYEHECSLHAPQIPNSSKNAISFFEKASGALIYLIISERTELLAVFRFIDRVTDDRPRLEIVVKLCHQIFTYENADAGKRIHFIIQLMTHYASLMCLFSYDARLSIYTDLVQEQDTSFRKLCPLIVIYCCGENLSTKDILRATSPLDSVVSEAQRQAHNALAMALLDCLIKTVEIDLIEVCLICHYNNDCEVNQGIFGDRNELYLEKTRQSMMRFSATHPKRISLLTGAISDLRSWARRLDELLKVKADADKAQEDLLKMPIADQCEAIQQLQMIDMEIENGEQKEALFVTARAAGRQGNFMERLQRCENIVSLGLTLGKHERDALLAACESLNTLLQPEQFRRISKTDVIEHSTLSVRILEIFGSSTKQFFSGERQRLLKISYENDLVLKDFHAGYKNQDELLLAYVRKTRDLFIRGNIWERISTSRSYIAKLKDPFRRQMEMCRLLYGIESIERIDPRALDTRSMQEVEELRKEITKHDACLTEVALNRALKDAQQKGDYSEQLCICIMLREHAFRVDTYAVEAIQSIAQQGENLNLKSTVAETREIYDLSLALSHRCKDEVHLRQLRDKINNLFASNSPERTSVVYGDGIVEDEEEALRERDEEVISEHSDLSVDEDHRLDESPLSSGSSTPKASASYAEFEVIDFAKQHLEKAIGSINDNKFGIQNANMVFVMEALMNYDPVSKLSKQAALRLQNMKEKVMKMVRIAKQSNSGSEFVTYSEQIGFWILLIDNGYVLGKSDVETIFVITSFLDDLKLNANDFERKEHAALGLTLLDRMIQIVDIEDIKKCLVNHWNLDLVLLSGLDAERNEHYVAKARESFANFSPAHPEKLTVISYYISFLDSWQQRKVEFERLLSEASKSNLSGLSDADRRKAEKQLQTIKRQLKFGPKKEKRLAAARQAEMEGHNWMCLGEWIRIVEYNVGLSLNESQEFLKACRVPGLSPQEDAKKFSRLAIHALEIYIQGVDQFFNNDLKEIYDLRLQHELVNHDEIEVDEIVAAFLERVRNAFANYAFINVERLTTIEHFIMKLQDLNKRAAELKRLIREIEKYEEENGHMKSQRTTSSVTRLRNALRACCVTSL